MIDPVILSNLFLKIESVGDVTNVGGVEFQIGIPSTARKYFRMLLYVAK